MIDTATGAPLKPRTLLVYYEQGYNIQDPQLITLVPLGLKMIAGDAMNSVDVRAANPWASSAYTWRCMSLATGTPVADAQQIPNCAVGTELWMMVTFPQCWDGVNLDSPDHKSHMSYPVDGACPKTHPVPLPEVSYNVIYDVPADNATRSWRLSSDTYDRSIPGGYSTHGDWMNGWNQDIMKAFIEHCDRASRDCHANLLGDGRELY